MSETINAFSTVVVACAAIVSAVIAFRMYKLENSRDLPASNFHCWIARDIFSFGTSGDWNSYSSLKLAISNRSQLPIYYLKLEVISKNSIPVTDQITIPKKCVLFTKTIDFVDDLKTDKVDSFAIPAEEVQFKPLKDFLGQNHKSVDTKLTMERIASELTVNYQFMDIYNQEWVRKDGKKLRRKRFYRKNLKIQSA